MINKPSQGAFARDVSVLAVGTALAQVVSFFLYPIIGRLYTPEEMAHFAVFTSLFTIPQVLSTGKYETSIFLAKNDYDAASIVTLVVSLCVIFCIVLTLIILGFADKINTLLSVNIGKLVYLVPVSVLSLTIFDTYNEWCIRKKYFPKLSLNKISNSVLVNGGKVGFAFTAFRGFGLILGDVLGRLVCAFICIGRIWRSDRQDFKGVSLSRIKKQAILFSKFPKFQMPSQLLNVLGASVPVLILSGFYDVAEVGFFSMTIAIMSVPTGVVGRAIRDVSRKRIRDSLISGEKNVYYLFSKLLKKTFLLSLVVALSIVFFLPDIFSLVLGDNWYQSGIYAQVLVPLFVVNFVATCVESAVLVAMKLKTTLFWQILYSVCNIAPILLGSLLGLKMIYTLTLYSASIIICFSVLIIISARSARYLDGLSAEVIETLDY